MNQAYNNLVAKIKQYNPSCDLTLLKKAYEIAREAHMGQTRESGEPFITHPLGVALILANLELDITSIIAGIFHDTLEDTPFTYDKLKEDFGEEVAMLVEGVTKLGKIPYTTKEEQQVENLRKMFLAMAKDIRVILIKLADRLHNMRTLKFMPKDKQLEKAKETLEIYAPLAHRLGISKIKWELEDICLRYIDENGYYDLVKKIDKKRREREAYVKEVIDTLKIKSSDMGIETYIEGRPKHFYSIYRKMVQQNKTIEQIYDLFALRIIVDSVKDCYALLGLVHELYKPIPGRFKDYIAMPKPNMYQSLHTTLIGPEGLPIEIQIRTWDMHRVAEVGIAAHWKYKEGNAGESELDNKLTWLRQLLDWQKEMRDARQFMENLKVDLFGEEVFVFTPKGDVMSLCAGSNPIDFAYNIHSDIGNKMMGAKVNGKIVPLEYELKNGDIIEILTASNIQGPSRDWLKIVKTSQAKNKIKQWFKKEKKEENIAQGRDIIEKELKKQSISFNQLFKPEWVENLVLKKFNFNSMEDMFAAVGYGGITANKIIGKLKDEYKKIVESNEDNKYELVQEPKKSRKKPIVSEHGIVVEGISNCLVRISRCCNPVPGDEIIGYITRGRGVSIHRRDCQNIMTNVETSDRFIDVRWSFKKAISYTAEVLITANDRPSLLSDITNLIGDLKIPMKAVNARATKNNLAIINITLDITNTEQLENLFKKIKRVSGVIDVMRGKQ